MYDIMILLTYCLRLSLRCSVILSDLLELNRNVDDGHLLPTLRGTFKSELYSIPKLYDYVNEPLMHILLLDLSILLIFLYRPLTSKLFAL
jgi:hypothetical protein